MTTLRTLGGDVVVPPISQALSWGKDYTGSLAVIDASQGTSGATPPQDKVGLEEGSEHYGPRWGAASLREAIAEDLCIQYGTTEITPEDVLVTAGCNEAFCVVTRALVAPGDSVVLLSPYYFNHDMWLKLNGIEPIYLTLSGDGRVDGKALLAATERAAAICAVSPGNPTGLELSGKSIELIASACRRYEIPFILDETYAFVRRNPSRPPHRLFANDEWRNHFISLRSMSKEFSIPGYRVGAAIGGQRVLEAAAKWHDCISIVAPSPGQAFAEFALAHLTDWRGALADDIRLKGERFVERLALANTGFEVQSWGGFFAWLKHPFVGMTDEEAAKRVASDVGVLTVPGSYFAAGDTGHLRLSYAALSGSVLDDIVGRLKEVSR
ncbi:MAG: aminotransferase class I/II-fold pyridoxal phosphate-dependent enzyme [Thermoleophilaceae bacterium]|nr:aminotransferase class I/II-fold pyridoxal phosphate-dependent enzyme [Thermoleophilaceae bacterium]